MGVLHGLVAALLGAGLGVQAFLSFLVAPATFRAVDRPVAARVMEGVFPGYYGFGLATMAMALALVVALAFREPSPLRWGTAALLALAVAGTLYAGRVVLPAAHAARLRAQAAPAGDLAPLEFSRLHRWAVAVNISVFATGAVALALHLATGASGRPGVGPRARVASERTHDNAPSGLGLQSVARPADQPPIDVLELDHVVLRVRDQAASQRFYTAVLGLRLDHVNEAAQLVQLRAGRHLIDLLPMAAGETAAPSARMDHVCLSVRCEDLAGAAAWLRQRGVTVEGDVVTRRGAFGDGVSLYIRDPDGYRIELKPRGGAHS